MTKKTIKILVNLIFILYKAFSVVLPCSCRFYPTCSDYSKNAITKYGFTKGLVLTFKRLLKCNPVFPGGYDPVK